MPINSIWWQFVQFCPVFCSADAEVACLLVHSITLRHFLKAFHISCLFLTKTSINDQLEDTVIKHICNNQPNKGLNSISERIIKFWYNFRTSFALIILNLFCAVIGKIDFIDGCNSKQSWFFSYLIVII